MWGIEQTKNIELCNCRLANARWHNIPDNKEPKPTCDELTIMTGSGEPSIIYIEYMPEMILLNPVDISVPDTQQLLEEMNNG